MAFVKIHYPTGSEGMMYGVKEHFASVDPDKPSKLLNVIIFTDTNSAPRATLKKRDPTIEIHEGSWVTFDSLPPSIQNSDAARQFLI